MIPTQIETLACPMIILQNPVTGEIIYKQFCEVESDNILALCLLNLFHNHYPKNDLLNHLICKAIYDFQDEKTLLINYEPVREEFLNLLTVEILEFGEVEYLFRLLGETNAMDQSS